jgi:hypothetical protein
VQAFCGYRTRLLSEGQAVRFAKCVGAHPAFTEVTVQESPGAKNPLRRHYVAYTAARPARFSTLRAREVRSRAYRAGEQADNYAFWPDPDHQGLFWCHNLTSNEVYEVSRGSCSCPDHTFRGARVGVPCKHMTLLRRQLSTRRARLSSAQTTLSPELFLGEGTVH